MLRVRQMPHPHNERESKQATVIELQPSSEQSEAARKWQELEQSIRNTSLTNSWPWIKAWLDNFDDAVQPTFAFAKLDNRLTYRSRVNNRSTA